METTNLIPARDLCIHYKIDISFISSLGERGLIEIITIEKVNFIHPQELEKFEKIARLHTELEINLEGIEAIHHLLQKVKVLQDNIRILQNKLGVYEPPE